MKKILYLDHAPYEGGAEVSLKELVSHLDRTQFEPIVVAPPEAPYLDLLREHNVEIIPLVFRWKQYWYGVPLLRDLLALVKIISQVKPDIIHANTRVTTILSGALTRLRLLLPMLRRVVIINHVRDRDPLPQWKLRLIGRADIIIANSMKVRDFLIAKGISECKVTVIYNGVDLHRFEQLKGDKLQTVPTITFIGQIYPRKGLDYLLKAMAIVKQTIPDVVLEIVGQDPTAEQIHIKSYERQTHSLDLTQNVMWLGYIKEIPQVLRHSFVLCLPALEEPFGRVLIEAMSMEIPVVATNVGGIPEVVVDGETGYLVPPKEVETLAASLLEILQSEKLRRSFGSAGRNRAMTVFNLDLHVQKIQNLYNHL